MYDQSQYDQPQYGEAPHYEQHPQYGHYDQQQYEMQHVPMATAVVAPYGYQQQHVMMPQAMPPGQQQQQYMGMQQGSTVVAPSVVSHQYTPMGYSMPAMPQSGGRKSSGGAQRASGGGPRVQVKVPWTHEEDLKVLDGVSRYGQSWAKIARDLPESRTDDAVRNRWHRLMSKQRRHESLVNTCNGDGTAVATAAPAEEEEEVVSEDDSNRPPKKRRGAKAASKSGPKPRPRTENNCEAAGGAYLGAGSKNGDMWTPEEDNIIDMAVRMQGLTWKAIAKLLPGRTESGCRNRWVRNQERAFAAAGMNVVGAAAVFAALNATRAAAGGQPAPAGQAMPQQLLPPQGMQPPPQQLPPIAASTPQTAPPPGAMPPDEAPMPTSGCVASLTVESGCVGSLTVGDTPIGGCVASLTVGDTPMEPL
eukprot:Transcript_4912.p2 GENE.Transcript_4912~~Transcript_4912.p2  ORF type:complete len:462 (-),score=168.09 Transcript_4912:430-1686(-)